ncbi:hypothetical protein GY45DRAFT_1329415 [Cubamyces sp. BRFM 1775]|nr:hypothetical protein GY45DRAFT_1329415 [Cubamyces sp. BRFM 1775]
MVRSYVTPGSTQTTQYDYDDYRRSGPWPVPLPDVYLSRNENSAQTYGFDPKDADSRYKRLGVDASRVTMGPMPVTDFLEEFLPARKALIKLMPRCKGAFNGIKANNANESDIYPILLKGLNSSKKSRCPGYSFRDTSNHPDQLEGKLGSIKPDIICYADRYLPEVKAHNGKGTNEWESVTRIAFAETFIEVKTNQSDDHYRDPPANANRNDFHFVCGEHARSLSKTADNLMQYLGQNVAYATDMCARQHRRFCFSVSVSGSSARLVRWDRCGAIVSEAFDYVAKPELLCEFFWRFAHLSDEQRGYDMTVQPATTMEEALFKEAIIEHIHGQIDCSKLGVFREVLDVHYMPGYVTVVSIPSTGNTPSPITHLLVSRPIVTPLFFAGRCTRTYWAVNPDPDAQQKVVLLKDTWRLNGRGSEEEGGVLRALEASGVPNIPRVLCAGDVMEGYSEGKLRTDETITRNYLKTCAWPCRRPLLRVRLVNRVHYRLVLDIAGFPLLSLFGTHELLHSTYDAFRALAAGFNLGRRLHRDVHPGNIILYNHTNNTAGPRTGYLVDWDNSCAINGRQHSKDIYRPSCQWQFVAKDLLQGEDVKPPHDIVHDMESILYVVLYCGLTRLPLTQPSNPVTFQSIMHNMFDIACEYEETHCGGFGKVSNGKNRQYTKLIVWEAPEIGQWINTVYDMYLPLSNAPPQQYGQWTVGHLDAFWTTFLHNNGGILRRSDRTDNVMKHKSLATYAPASVTERPRQATIGAPSTLRTQSTRTQKPGAQVSLPTLSAATRPPSSSLSSLSDITERSESPEPVGHRSPVGPAVGGDSLTPGPSMETLDLRRSTRTRKRTWKYIS